MYVALLTWGYSFTDNTGFLLQRSTDSGSTWPTNIVITSSAGSQEYLDEDVVLGGTYWYRVFATNEFGQGPSSNIASVYLAHPGVTTLTITAVGEERPYDGTTGSYVAPTVDGAVRQEDTPDFTQFYADKHVGSPKTLTPTGSVVSVSGYPYSYTYVPADVGTIDPAGVNVYGSTDTKSYDGNNSSSATPFWDYLAPGDTVDSSSLTQSFDNFFIGDGKIMNPQPITIDDGNSGNNYSQNTDTENPVGVISGPPSSSAYVSMPAETDVPYDDGWFISISSVASGSNGFITWDYLPASNILYVLKSDNFSNWTPISSSDDSIYARTFAYGNGTYIGVEQNDCWYSTDGGLNWTYTTTGASNFIFSILYDGARFVGVGQHGQTITSSNGIDWWAGSIGTDDPLNKVIYGGGLYVGVPYWQTVTGYVYISSDFETWQTSSLPQNVSWWGVAYSPTLGKYMAVGDGAAIALSDDGVNWTDYSNPPLLGGETLGDVVWNSVDQKFIVASVGGYIYETPDGINWGLYRLNPSYQYHGSYYSYVTRMMYDPSINKTLIIGMAPPT